MIRWIVFVRKRKALTAEVNRAFKLLSAEKNAARNRAANIRDMDTLYIDYKMEAFAAWDTLQAHISSYWMNTALRLGIPSPPSDDQTMWTSSNHIGKKYLTMEGVMALRSAIRAERRESSEYLRLWLPTLISGIAAVGAWVAAFRH